MLFPMCGVCAAVTARTLGDHLHCNMEHQLHVGCAINHILIVI